MKYIFIILVLITYSCDHPSNIEELEINKIKKLEGHLIKNIPPACYKDGILKDSLLVLLNECGDYLFQIYNNNSYCLINEFGKEGRGPLEFIYPVFMNDIDSSTTLSIHDMSQFNICKINLGDDSLNYSRSQLPRKLIRSYNINIIDSNYIATSITNESDSALFFIYNNKSKENINIPYIPKFALIESENSLLDKRTIYSNFIKVAPKENSIVVAFKFLNLVNFYNLNGELKRSCSIKNIIEPIDSRSIDVSENTIVTFYQSYATSNFCYILWKGEPIECDETNLKAKVFVFNWQGDLHEVYEFPNRPQFIIVDEKHNKIMGGVYSEKKEFVEIYEYKLL